MSAWAELQSELAAGESIEAIVFGPWGWGSAPRPGEAWGLGYEEPDPAPVPFELRGKLLSAAEAEPMMQTWKFSGGFGAPDCYAVRIWTNQRVFWVHEYDGSTGLSSAPRNPITEMPGLS